MFLGEERRKNHDLIDRLQAIAQSAGRSVAELVINWTTHQPASVLHCAARSGLTRSSSVPAAAAGDFRPSSLPRLTRP